MICKSFSLKGGESMLYDSSIVVKWKNKPFRCRYRKHSINKIYGTQS